MTGKTLREDRRLRRSPFTHLAEAAGASGWTIYNHMLLPVIYRSAQEDYAHLKRAVQVWDVAAERQVEVTGPDAAALVQALTPRRVHDAKVMRCYYVPIVDRDGMMLNDPLLLRPDEERWWLSIADSDVTLMAKGFAAGRKLDVTITEPDVNPLAVQGPRANELMGRVFGSEVADLKFFAAGRFPFEGKQLIVARSGWSGQGGFEIFVEGTDICEPLWHALFEAGEDLDVRAGCPNGIERIEAGLLSYGNDMTAQDDPFECGLARYVDEGTDCIANDALRARVEPSRKLRGLLIDGDPLPGLTSNWIVNGTEGRAGHVTSAANSPDHGRGIGIAMLDRRFWNVGTSVTVACPDGPRAATVADLPLRPPAA